MREKVWEDGNLVADVATETNDPNIAKTYSSVTNLDDGSSVRSADQSIHDDAVLDDESAVVVQALIGYFIEQV